MDGELWVRLTMPLAEALEKLASKHRAGEIDGREYDEMVRVLKAMHKLAAPEAAT